ncbi:hypothetical protein, partial [Rhizobium rhizogenes]
LPPAFVLSQDQTLMLRIQSRLNHVILNRRELTPVSNQIFASQRLSGQLHIPSMQASAKGIGAKETECILLFKT